MSIQIVVFPKGALGPKDKERLTKSGIIYIETDSKDIYQLQISPPLLQNVVNADGIVKACLRAIGEGAEEVGMKTSYGRFAKYLAEYMGLIK